MKYSFIKDVDVIDENTIEFDTRIMYCNGMPLEFKDFEDSNCVTLTFNAPIRVWVNGRAFLWDMEILPDVCSVDSNEWKKEIFRVRMKRMLR